MLKDPTPKADYLNYNSVSFCQFYAKTKIRA